MCDNYVRPIAQERHKHENNKLREKEKYLTPTHYTEIGQRIGVLT